MKIKLNKKQLKTLNATKEINNVATQKIAAGNAYANPASWTSAMIFCDARTGLCPVDPK
ncbi:hypothetical protein PSECIP111854_00690 [Pseudoalteromonas sp. CIP111854]|uniref:Uncharacterized protein n=1 Tax=Pseudoalteromonas holothuriae TaxID=2963714 RepID=A0A9W4QSE2_9GAMM|nr:hypothetical protein [Pseudoalteromonas sp. CIP111854]CAH9051160.1 hypothetical protein PSECIP111854_00690 [Pseudoalteromonas sp. CIP111854]